MDEYIRSSICGTYICVLIFSAILLVHVEESLDDGLLVLHALAGPGVADGSHHVDRVRQLNNHIRYNQSIQL